MRLKRKIVDLLDKDGKLRCDLCNKELTFKHGGFTRHLKREHSTTIQEFYLKHVDEDGGKCECGCGESTTWQPRGGYFKRFISGHNYRGKTKENDPTVAVRARKMKEHENWKKSAFKKGQKPWNLGLTKETCEKVKEVEIARQQTLSKKSREWHVNLRRKMVKTAKENFRSGKRVSHFALASDEERAKWIKKAMKTRNSRPANLRYRSGKYSSKFGETFYQSSYELRYMKMLDENEDVNEWGRCQDLIPYHHEGKVRYYNPDFYVSSKEKGRIVVEVKGWVDPTVKPKAEAAYRFYEGAYQIVTMCKHQKKFIDITNEVLCE